MHRPILVAALGLLVPVVQAETVSGLFSAHGCTFEPAHATALLTPEGEPMVIFSDRALTLDLAYEFDPKQAMAEDLTLGDQPADKGLSLTLIGETPNHFFWCTDAESGQTAQLSGTQGEATLELKENSASRIAGHWRLSETKDAFGRSSAWDLTFDVPISDPAAEARTLPEGGGEPGAAYQAYLEDIESGDIPALRKFLNNPYFFKQDASDDVLAEDLKMTRENQPETARILAGTRDDGTAILDMEVTMRDGSERRMQVLLEREDDAWLFSNSRSLD